MEKKKIDLGAVASGAGKAAAGLFGKAKNAVVNTIDQNNDGKLDLGDVSIICDLPAHSFTITVMEWEGPVTFEITM